jgi:hypothetical protein
MKKHLVIISAIFFLVCTGLLSGVSLAAKSVDDIIYSQQRRIEQGIASGALTHSEAEILEGNLHYIRTTYHKAVADGMLTARESSRLHNMLKENSNQIYNKKHNAKVRRLY